MFYAKILKQLRVLHHLLLPGNQLLTYCITDISYCLLLLYIVLDFIIPISFFLFGPKGT